MVKFASGHLGMNGITENKIKQLDELITKSSHIVIISHTHADGDAVGSTSGMLSYLTERRKKSDVHIILPNDFGEFLQFVPGAKTLYSENGKDADEYLDRADLIIVLDLNNLKRADALGEAVKTKNATKVLIDHHLSPAENEFDLIFSTPEISSTCEYLYQILLLLPDIDGKASNLPSDCRTALMTGMTTDTNNFANSVYPSTLKMASELLEAGVDRNDILLHLYHEYRENRVRAIGWLTYKKLVIREDGFAYIILDKKTAKRFDLGEGETEGLVNIPLTLKSVKVSALFKEDDGYFRVSLRSKAGISVNEFAGEYFHGGGHAQASGGKLHFPEDIPGPKEAEAYINSAAEKFMKQK